MTLRWILLLLLGLNLAYLGWALHRAPGPAGDRENHRLQDAPGISEIRLIDSLVDSPPPDAAEGRGPIEAPGRGPEMPVAPVDR